MKKLFFSLLLLIFSLSLHASETLMLRQPTISSSHIVYSYGGDLWISDLSGNQTMRLTSTAAIESNPHFSPDGKTIAFNSNRSGVTSIYTLPIEGGTPTRLTWYPSSALARGWTSDGKNILYSSQRETAPAAYSRLWTVSKDGGAPTLLTQQWGFGGSFSPDGKQIVIEPVSRWDSEWRAYRGGQNTPLVILNLSTFEEELLPNNHETDIRPVWLDDKIYFLSDRDLVSNIWSYDIKTKTLEQLTHYKGADIKSLGGCAKQLVFAREGSLHLMQLPSGKVNKLKIEIKGDFPWAETQWEDVSRSISSASLSPTGKRAIFEARGEIFTVPQEHGDTRNITKTSGEADRAPIWSPLGDKIAWFSDKGGNGYSLLIGSQDGLSEPESISIGESKMAWEPCWSPDGKYIAFNDDDVRIRVVDIKAKTIKTIDIGENNLERGRMGLTWSPDSKWLAYSKSAANKFRQITIWSLDDNSIHKITNTFADAFSPAWDLDKKHLYFLASTDLALASGWANTSSMASSAYYSVYVVNLKENETSPFVLRSDEEAIKAKDKPASKKQEKTSDKKTGSKKAESGKSAETEAKKEAPKSIDFDDIDRRIIPLNMPKSRYRGILAGPAGNIFTLAAAGSGYTMQKYTLKTRKAAPYASGVKSPSISADGKSILGMVGSTWQIMNAAAPSNKGSKILKTKLNMKLDRSQEWEQIFEEAWRYQRDYFYDPNMHGRDWDKVYKRYKPLLPYVKHRADLSVLLDQMNGELSVGHSFVSGGDYPSTESNKVGILGADLVPEDGYWKIARIYTTESWNPGLSSPLDEPGLKVKEGYYLVGINGQELTATDNPYEFLDGTLGVQTLLHVSEKPNFNSAHKISVKPNSSSLDLALRQRAWVEDNRRKVDELSDGKLAYIWVPNTTHPGFVSFNRYYFAQQDKQGAVIDERFNGGGLLDDYMVDLMTRNMRAALTNEVPNGKPMVIPAGILGPKVLLINEKAGSGGDFFPWIFRQQNVGTLIGKTTWGGLVKSSTHYKFIDGGYMTAPDNAVFDPDKNEWVGENKGIAPDIEVRQDAKSLEAGRDPQLERAVKELMKDIKDKDVKDITPPPFPKPALGK
ncbi:MAG: PDZ domain-containing protein [Bacteroidales bacterium]